MTTVGGAPKAVARASGADGPGLAGSVADRLGVAEAAVALDPAALARSLMLAMRRLLRQPHQVAALTGIAVQGQLKLLAEEALDLAGLAKQSSMEEDRRFADPVYDSHRGYRILRQQYKLSCELVLDAVERAGLEEPMASKARFAAQLLVDALAPTNTLVGNPVAIREAVVSGGASLARGTRNLARDVATNGGWPTQVDRSPFVLGENMAPTPGKVVYRNELVELIQYGATTDRVHEIPLLCCPPWINKYYIMDLAPGKSLVRWAVDHGLTTFALSYRNPDRSTGDLGFEDYLLSGPRAGLDVVREITGAPSVNTLAICLGGTLNSCLLGYLRATGESDLVHTSTTLNALSDFNRTGVLGSVFADSSAVDGLDRRMRRKGYLEAKDMAHTFDLLRANDLVFSYVASGWLMGRTPPAFDLLAWNADSTRMPAKMHSFYLRKFYGDNALARGSLELAGQRISLSEVDTPLYMVAAVDDHIVPWQAAYQTTQLTSSVDLRFVLTSSGHIAGIVNPPSRKSRLWANDDLPADASRWLAAATEQQQTWWNDWADWITPRSGDLTDPPARGSAAHPPIMDAPGSYVFG